MIQYRRSPNNVASHIRPDMMGNTFAVMLAGYETSIGIIEVSFCLPNTTGTASCIDFPGFVILYNSSIVVMSK